MSYAKSLVQIMDKHQATPELRVELQEWFKAHVRVLKMERDIDTVHIITTSVGKPKSAQEQLNELLHDFLQNVVPYVTISNESLSKGPMPAGQKYTLSLAMILNSIPAEGGPQNG